MLYRDGKKVKSDSDDDSTPEDDSTTLIPKSLVPKGAKVGDKVMMEIVHAYDDELEVSYSHSRKKDDDSESTSDLDRADSELDALATPSQA